MLYTDSKNIQDNIRIIVERFQTNVKYSNPNFTEDSLNRAIEVTIINTLDLDFMTIMSPKILKEVKDYTWKYWNGRVRKSQTEIKEGN